MKDIPNLFVSYKSNNKKEIIEIAVVKTDRAPSLVTIGINEFSSKEEIKTFTDEFINMMTVTEKQPYCNLFYTNDDCLIFETFVSSDSLDKICTELYQIYTTFKIFGISKLDDYCGVNKRQNCKDIALKYANAFNQLFDFVESDDGVQTLVEKKVLKNMRILK